MKRLIVDLDDTVSFKLAESYKNAIPDMGFIKKLKRYKEEGFEIVINTSRNMRTYEGNIGKINKYTLPIIKEWLDIHLDFYDEIYVGKPWCGFDGFYIDDMAILPIEFMDNGYDEIKAILKNDSRREG